MEELVKDYIESHAGPANSDLCQANLISLWNSELISNCLLTVSIWIFSMIHQPEKAKTDLLSFTAKSTTLIVLSISLNCPSIHPLDKAKTLSMGNPNEKDNKISPPLLLHCYHPNLSSLTAIPAVVCLLFYFLTLSRNPLLHFSCT